MLSFTTKSHVQAITGIFQVFLFNQWLDHGVEQLSFEVTISCAALMLTCKLFIWRIGLLTSGKSLVQHKLQFLLLRKYMSMEEQALSAEVEGASLDDRFQEAITSTAAQLSSDCYLAAQLALSSFWGFIFAIVFLFYHAFESDYPLVALPAIMNATLIVAPIWLAIVLVAISAFRAPEKAEPSTGHKRKRSFDEWFSTETILTGILWITTYVRCPPASPRRATASARTVSPRALLAATLGGRSTACQPPRYRPNVAPHLDIGPANGERKIDSCTHTLESHTP